MKGVLTFDSNEESYEIIFEPDIVHTRRNTTAILTVFNLDGRTEI